MDKTIADDLFHYKDGALYRRKQRGPCKKGDRVGSICTDGRLQVKVSGRMFYVHRIIYLMHHGHMPEFVDHKNGDHLDNRIENLRSATRSENNRNAKLRVDNTSGIKGVGLHRGKWRARINVDNQQIHLGYFETKEEAEERVEKERKNLHKDFTRRR
jgi:hypothetical protein